MASITVNTHSGAYPIYLENSFDRLSHAFNEAGLTNRKMAIVTDSHVAPLYLKEAADRLAPSARSIATVQFEAGESQKHLKTVGHMYDAFLANQIDRSSVVVSLGGGVTGDMAGFAAATYMRGIPFVQLPTTLLSQVDAGVGGKTGVDHRGVKNLIGAFYQPSFVYTNLATLQTLSEDDYRSGLGEVVKHGLLGLNTGHDRYFQYIADNREAVRLREPKALYEMVMGSCLIKAKVVSLDERETGIRETLNLGHTFGHAIESLKDYTMPHGVCVSVGMTAALYLSAKLGNIAASLLEETKALLAYFNLPTKVEGLSSEMIYQKMFSDKKTKNDTLRLVLLGKNGAYTEGHAPDTLLREALAYICD